jgi:hypothetical protein
MWRRRFGGTYSLCFSGEAFCSRVLSLPFNPENGESTLLGNVDYFFKATRLHIFIVARVGTTDPIVWGSVWRRLVWKNVTDVSEEPAASIHRIEQPNRSRNPLPTFLLYISYCTLKMEAASSSETTATMYQTTLWYIPGHRWAWAGP